MNLTEKMVQKLKPSDKREQHFDDSLTGFAVRVEPDGTKNFVWIRKVNGKGRFKSLGEYPATSVATARADAEELNGKAAEWKRNGFQPPDPFEKAKSTKPSAVPTFRDLVEAFKAYVIDTAVTSDKPDEKAVFERRTEKAIYQIDWRTKRFLSDWLSRPVDSITVQDVLDKKRDCGARHVTFNRLLAFVHRLYSWSGRNRNGKINFFNCENPAAGVEGYEETPRTRHLKGEELNRFKATLKRDAHFGLRSFLVLAIQTGARRSDIFSMRWKDIDWENETWLVPFPKETKRGKRPEPYTVQLLPAALDILKKRKAIAAEGAEFVFPGSGKTGHVTDYRDAWAAFRDAAQLTDFHFHDCRHTAASVMANAGVDLFTVGKALGHKSPQSTLIYSHLINDTVREARERGERKMVEIMKKAQRRLNGAKAQRQLSA